MADDEPGWFFGWRALLTTLMMLGRPRADAAADESDDEDVPIDATEELCANHDVCGGHGLRLENGLCMPCVDGVGARLAIDAYDAHGLVRVLDSVRRTRNFPISS